MSTLKTTNLQNADASSANIVLGQGSGGGATISGVTTSSTLRATTGIVTSLVGGSARFTDDGSASPTVSIQTDDANPYALNIGNQSYSADTSYGLNLYNNNSGEGYFRHVGNSAYLDYHFSLHNNSSNKLCLKFESDDQSVELYAAGSKKFETTETGTVTTGISTATTFAPSVGWLGNRNMIINGGMTVSQRGTQTSITSATYTLDRFKLNVTNCGAYTVSQLGGSDELINTGGRNSLKVDCTTADASPAASDLVLIQQPLEGLVTNPLCWGTSGGKKAVLSFWAKADVNGWSSGTKDFVVEIQASDSQEFSAVCQLAAAGTWQKFVIPIDAKTSSAIAYDNTESMGINWWLDAGTNFKGGTGVTGWSAKGNTGGVRAAQQTLAIAAHTDNNFYLTNVQFEVSDTYATPFESRSFGDELRRCQRYFQRVNGSLYGIGASATSIRANYTPPVNFRVSPTITGNAAVTFNNPGINSPTQSSFNCGIQHTYTPNNIGIGLGFGNFTNATQGYTYIQWDADDEYIDFSAEM